MYDPEFYFFPTILNDMESQNALSSSNFSLFSLVQSISSYVIVQNSCSFVFDVQKQEGKY